MKALPSAALAGLLALAAAASAADAARTSDGGSFRVSWSSALQPIAINRIHEWVLHLETVAGEPLEGASIAISGGMPAHDHGLPTSPRVTEDLGDGDYRVEGMRFHMGGSWEVSVEISAGGLTETAVIPLEL